MVDHPAHHRTTTVTATGTSVLYLNACSSSKSVNTSFIPFVTYFSSATKPSRNDFRMDTPPPSSVATSVSSDTSSVTADNTTTDTMTATCSTPAPTKARSKEEIARLVQQRVQERDAWLVDGIPQEKVSTLQEGVQFTKEVLPKFLKFSPPSQGWLDEHFPVQSMDWERLQNPPSDDGSIQITWLGHASLLLQVNGCTIVTDPVFSQRCAPTQWQGPKRARQPPCTIQELCQHITIDVVLISHNHYDHLDTASVRDIHKYSPKAVFIVPLGIKAWCHKNIGQQAVVQEMDWREHVDYSYSPTGNDTQKTVRIISLPMRHWTSRVGADRDKTLWCGYSVVTEPESDAAAKMTRKLLFPGDTAWFDGLDHLVGQVYGPFDVAAIPIGAYEPREFMKRNHINVDEAVRMKDALQARNAVPIHWGTFPLTVEPWLEPRERLQELMEKREDAGSFDALLIGETKVFQTT